MQDHELVEQGTGPGNPNAGLRESGIEVIGAVPWGTHFCQFYATRQDLIETLVPYFKAGLEGNEFCMWVTSAPLQVDQATAALRAAAPELDAYLQDGQIEILDYSEWYTPTGHFDADSVLEGWKVKLAAAKKRGFSGLRLTGNTFWLEQADWEDFTRYEEKVNEVIGSMDMMALCTYSLEKCGPREILDVIANHQFALVKNDGQWEIIESATHKKMEQSLRENEERLSLAVRAAGLGVFEWDVDSDQPSWENPRMYEIFGRRPEDGPVNREEFLTRVVHPDDRDEFEAALVAAMQPGHPFNTSCRIILPDGDIHWIKYSGHYRAGASGAGLVMVGVIEDITEGKRFENMLKENAANLERLNRELQDFAYVASHDLKEPLRKIATFSDRLQESASGKLAEEERDYLDRISDAATRMQKIIDDLLVYSLIVAHPESTCRVDLTQVIADVLGDLEVRLEQSGGQVDVGPMPVVQAEPGQMRQLFLNLISNALKFHKTGEPPFVQIRARRLAGRQVEITVSDDGIGLDMELAGKLFQPFRRLVSRREYEGNGIGLSICKKIVERHHGSISVQSTAGQGATFTVVLPE